MKGHIMALLRNSGSFALAFFVVTSMQAQVSSIDSAVLQPRVFNDIQGATITSVNNYPSAVSFSESGVSAATGFANRDVWRLSNDGATPFLFGNTDYFHISVNLTLTGTPITPRKEAGLLLSSTGSGDIQLIVNTDAHEVVQFGGISFHSFGGAGGLTYNSGDTITLGMRYFLNDTGNNALMFSANGVNSPVFEFAAGAGIGAGSTLGGYFQIANDSANAANAGSASFANIVVVPEPSVMALFGLGAVALLLRWRKTG
jgi:hypothetical protein